MCPVNNYYMNNHQGKIIFLFIIISWLIFSISPIVLADTCLGTSCNVPNPIGSDNFVDLLDKIAQWIFNIGLVLAVIMVIWSGVLFMTAGGNEEKIKKAKQTLLWTIIGATIIIGCKGLISLVKDILGVQGVKDAQLQRSSGILNLIRGIIK